MSVILHRPWLGKSRDVAADQGFFHWDLDFASVFAHGRFDLQVGNPPWVRPRTDVDALLSESDPWFGLVHKPTQEQKAQRRNDTITSDQEAASVLVSGVGETIATAEFIGSITTYPFLQGQQTDLYRGFMERTWSNSSPSGVVSLIHPESHFTEKKAATLRREAYLRLRRHWQFINELVLFDIDHHVQYGVHIYSNPQTTPTFATAASLYHPQTVIDSLAHDGSGPPPGLKDDYNQWDRRPHRDRIQAVDESVLKTWKSVLEDEATPWLDTRMVYTVNTEASTVLEKLAAAPRMEKLRLQFSSGWHESADKKKGYFDVGWGHPASWDDVILQGPHLGVSNPMQKQPNPTMKHNQDWTEIDLEALPADFIPATAYQPKQDATYREDYAKWEHHGDMVPSSNFYRIAWRKMAATTGYRTLYPAIIPPGSVHIDGVISAAATTNSRLTCVAGAFASSILVDFVARAMGVANLHGAKFDLLPTVQSFPSGERIESIIHEITMQYLRLNCLTRSYAPLWEEATGQEWSPEVGLYRAEDRRNAQVDIDAMVAFGLGISADELCTIYRTQFPVMRRYDEEDRFDSNGRIVPKEIVKADEKLDSGMQLCEADRTWVHPQSEASYLFEYPFRVLDREDDLRRAFERFGRVQATI